MDERNATVEIPLSQGKVALVDVEDTAAVLQHRWYAQRVGQVWYAQRSLKRPDGQWGKQRLHVFLTGYAMTDHRNGDGLDNTRANLRAATKVENGRNRAMQANNAAGFKGVSWDSARCKWRAQIKTAGPSRYIGRFDTAEQAARAYDEAARAAFGEYAHLNFP